ncbi:hypothetical protein SDC9_159015 [bioreactor metagenome]|uniref:Uncharacterized protein n=1 Tax=bioreactor metagenome TaxID=1076179 RepID=A0A645FBG8_9ZZZZ
MFRHLCHPGRMARRKFTAKIDQVRNDLRQPYHIVKAQAYHRHQPLGQPVQRVCRRKVKPDIFFSYQVCQRIHLLGHKFTPAHRLHLGKNAGQLRQDIAPCRQPNAHAVCQVQQVRPTRHRLPLPVAARPVCPRHMVAADQRLCTL